jgi:F-type H+-transporting ATPase subunit b
MADHTVGVRPAGTVKLSRILPLLAAGLLMLPAAAMAEGMPQLDFSTPLTLSQVVWGAIIFIVLYILVSRWALPQVSRVLDQRAATLEADLEAAHAMKAKSTDAVAELTATIAKARAEAQAAINAAVDRAKQEAAAQSAVLNERLEAQLREAEERIAQARGSAMNALRQVATETATTVIQRLTGTAPDTRAVEGAVGGALAARGR